MERVQGIGGYFLRAPDPAALSTWYRDCLGLDADANEETVEPISVQQFHPPSSSWSASRRSTMASTSGPK